MLKTERFVLELVGAILLGQLSGCNSTPQPQPSSTSESSVAGPTGKGPSACDCSTFPPRSGCDAQCGITTGIVESVSADSVVIQVPSIKTDSVGKRFLMSSMRTFSIGAAEAKQLQSIPKGSRVALTFRQEDGKTVVQSIRRIAPEPES
jgi:Cu/Ag efflux protein CusF